MWDRCITVVSCQAVCYQRLLGKAFVFTTFADDEAMDFRLYLPKTVPLTFVRGLYHGSTCSGIQLKPNCCLLGAVLLPQLLPPLQAAVSKALLKTRFSM